MQKTELIHEVRAVKNTHELGNIVAAQRISERVLADVLKKLRTGVTELEIANFIKRSFVKYKAPILSFPPIVAFGKNSADIHHEPSKTKLKVGDLVMFDFGTTIKHYCSDMTRSYFWGKPTARQKKVYSDVLRAMELALLKIGKGEKKAKIIDASARSYLGKRYKNNFQHGLGHGVGTVIHEWPGFKPNITDILPVGAVMTIEPGLYFKGWGGIRIEDMVLITEKGYKNLTNVPKDISSITLIPR